MKSILKVILYVSIFLIVQGCNSDSATTKQNTYISEEHIESDDEANLTGLNDTTESEENLESEQEENLESSEDTNGDKIKIFTIGDSTVHNRYARQELMGWANESALGSYMMNSKNLYNRARSGASSKTYYHTKEKDKYDWNQTKELIQKIDITNGAYLLIQFGHNDELRESKGTTTGVFREYLIRYVDWAINNDLTPILITPVERRIKKEHEETHKSHGEYAKIVRELAKERDITLLDLQNKSWNEYNKYKDTEELNKVFSEYRRNDKTHFSPKGAKIIGRLVKELICDKDKKLCSVFK